MVSLSLVLEVVVLVVGLESLQVVNLLGIPPSCSIRGWEDFSFEMERRNGPRSSFRGFGPPPVREGWFPDSGYHGGVRGDSFGMKDVLDCANPTLEKMAQHWFYSFGTNPSAESFVRSRACFLILGWRLDEHLVD
jgi:hypothetical protein